MTLASQIDHFTFIKNHERLLELFENELELPIVWPYADFGTFESAAFHAGNLVFEMVRPKFSQPSDYAITLLAAGRLNATLDRFHRLGLRYYAPWRMRLTYPCPWTVPHRELLDTWLLAQGGSGTLWEIAAVPEILPQRIGLLVADYHADFRELGALSRTKVLAAPEGADALGWLNVKSFHLSVSTETLHERRAQLAKLMGSSKQADQANARVLLLPGSKDGFAGMVARVRSLSQARRFLARRNLLGCSDEHHLCLATEACPDFEIRFEAAS